MPHPSRAALSETDLHGVFTELGVPLRTSPEVMRRLLCEYQLDRFPSATSPFFASFLAEAQQTSMDLKPLITTISRGILDNPALSEFISLSLALIKSSDDPLRVPQSSWRILGHTIIDLAHTILILEMCVVTMLNSSAFLQEIFFHLSNVRARFGISSSSLQRLAQIARITGAFFAVKIQSVEPALVMRSFLREHGGTITAAQVQEVIAAHPQLNFLDKLQLKSCINQNREDAYNSIWAMNINIEEAMLTDKVNAAEISGIDNASAGYALVHYLASSSIGTHYMDIRVPILPRFCSMITYASYTKCAQPQDLIRAGDFCYQADLPKEWIDLYMSWNLAFVVKNVLFPELTLAKLLIPSTMCAKQENWLDARVYSLWLITSFYLSMHITGHINLKTQMPRKVPMPIKQIFIPLFGRINKQHGERLLHNFLGWDAAHYEQQLGPLREPGWRGWLKSIGIVLNTVYYRHPTPETSFGNIDDVLTWIKIARANFASIIIRDDQAICYAATSLLQKVYHTQQYRAEIERAWGVFLAACAPHNRTAGVLDAPMAYRSPLTSQLVREVLVNMQISLTL